MVETAVLVFNINSSRWSVAINSSMHDSSSSSSSSKNSGSNSIYINGSNIAVGNAHALTDCSFPSPPPPTTPLYWKPVVFVDEMGVGAWWVDCWVGRWCLWFRSVSRERAGSQPVRRQGPWNRYRQRGQSLATATPTTTATTTTTTTTTAYTESTTATKPTTPPRWRGRARSSLGGGFAVA